MATLAEVLVDAALAVPNLDGASDALAGVANEAYALAGDAGRTVKDLLNGTWLGHPLHPAITDVPVGAWTAALVMDLLGERRGAKIAVGVGLAGALGAAASGLTDWLDTYGRPRRLGLVHAAVNGTATLLYAGSFFARDRSPGFGVALSALGYAAVSLGALFGGVISLDMQIGVNHAHANEPPKKELDVAALTDVPDGGMKRVDANGYPVLLTRRGDEVHAIAAVCAHQGGPLEKGKFDGDVVTCPWHGSQFCVRDGGIVHGPAAYPQPAFNVRIAGERVLIRAAEES
ncbi:MAG: Rieske 2Fe-2S domain-containing protein [Candidatus Eremiobacteraeota bacterium]|nr:Rieske 2Fe-2S domain-containing protein [Candidatus Eremiobacteraeota bacterium]